MLCCIWRVRRENYMAVPSFANPCTGHSATPWHATFVPVLPSGIFLQQTDHAHGWQLALNICLLQVLAQGKGTGEQYAAEGSLRWSWKKTPRLSLRRV